jgi:mannose-6-phosphate isomerase-like protein (cupin superfamily)
LTITEVDRFCSSSIVGKERKKTENFPLHRFEGGALHLHLHIVSLRNPGYDLDGERYKTRFLTMRIERINPTALKGWYAGPWNSGLAISLGYANVGIDEPHVHSQITEIYLVARGWAEIRVEEETVKISSGDVLILSPGEAHTFLSSSPDYFHFVIHTPGLAGKAAQAEKIPVERARFGGNQK